MAAASIPMEEPGGGPIKFISITLLVAIAVVFISLAVSHAEIKHGTDEANSVRNCIDKNGASSVWMTTNTKTGKTKTGIVCKLDTGEFGIQVLEDGENEVTAFIRRRVDQVKVDVEEIKHYMESNSWKCIYGCK